MTARVAIAATRVWQLRTCDTMSASIGGGAHKVRLRKAAASEIEASVSQGGGQIEKRWEHHEGEEEEKSIQSHEEDENSHKQGEREEVMMKQDIIFFCLM